MSLYDGTDLDREVRSEELSANGGTWNSGMKLLQSHIQLKKASIGQPGGFRQRDRSSGAASSSLSSFADKKTTKNHVVVHQLPFFSVASSAKDSLFDEFNIEDEYNPLYPNDYEKAAKRRDEERRKSREEDKRKDVEDRHKRKYARSDDEDDEDDSEDRERNIEYEKRSSGAAIAPPQSLTGESQPNTMDDEKPNYQPDFGMGSKGLNVAAKIMEKYGYKQGLGLGKTEQGMSTALHVEKTSYRGGKIIHERDAASKDLPVKSEQQINENLEPITEVLKNPTKVVLLKNIVGPGQVDEDLEPEIKEEMYKYGDVVSVVIFEIPGQAEEEAMRIFVEFQKIDQAIKAVVSLHGRFFAGRSIRAAFYDYEKFKSYDLAD